MAGHVLISSVKNEGPFLLEWVAHHMVLGFDRIYVASNDCSDGSDDLLDALQGAGSILHLRNVVEPGEIPQHVGYARMRARYPLDEADWLMTLDADEFLNVHTDGHKVQDLTATAAPDVDLIALSARTFSGEPQRRRAARAFGAALCRGDGPADPRSAAGPGRARGAPPLRNRPCGGLRGGSGGLRGGAGVGVNPDLRAVREGVIPTPELPRRCDDRGAGTPP